MYNHVVLIGLNFQFVKSTGDKNYWSELIKLLAKGLKRITIISVRKHKYGVEELYINGCYINVRYIQPKFLETPGPKYYRPRIFWRKGAFPSWLGIIEKRLDISSIANELKSVYREYPFEHIHLMDNFGLGNKTIVKVGRFFEAAASVSAISYQGKNLLLYHPYLRLSYRINNLSIVSYSASFRRKLIEIGLKENRVVHIPWGVVQSGCNYSSFINKKYMAKRDLGLSINKPLFLWSGYIQQIQKKDFILALNKAKEALDRGLDATFYFAFKPENKIENVKNLNNYGNRIIAKTTTMKEFALLKKACDVFYSPVCNKKVILAPPLTWIEVMSEGVPILTTDVGGAGEIVEDSKTGIIAKNNEEILDKLFEIRNCYKRMSDNCCRKVKEKFDIKRSAREYLKLWNIGDYNAV